MDIIVLLVLLAIIISQSVLLYFVLQKHNEEKQILLSHLKDLTDKLYFTKSEDFISNKIVGDENKKEEAKENGHEEEMIPLENVPIEDLAKAYGVKIKE
jgi:hypothetical protein